MNQHHYKLLQTSAKKNYQKLTTLFQSFLANQKLINQKILLSVSGGVDSMVLLDVALKTVAAENIAVFHVNHTLREQSELEYQYLEKFCADTQIAFYGYELSHSPTKNKENTWRQARKNCATEAKELFGAGRVLTAHHATDLVETMIFRLVKGAGPNGLSPFDTSTKPFWQIPKKILIEYAIEKKLTWFEDDTNQDGTYHRNLIRHEVIPALRHITPNLEQVFVKEAKLFGLIDEYLETETQNFLDKYQLANPFLKETLKINAVEKKVEYQVPLTEFSSLADILQRSVLRKISQGQPSNDEIDDALRWINGNPAGNSQKKVGKITILIKKNKILF